MSWFAKKAAPAKAQPSREMMWARVAVLASHVKDRMRQEQATKNPEETSPIFTPRPLLEAQAICKTGRALTQAEVQTLLAGLKKIISPKVYEEVIGKMNAWNVPTKFGNDSGKQRSEQPQGRSNEKSNMESK